MNKMMNTLTLPSLEHRCLIEIIIKLWENNIFSLMNFSLIKSNSRKFLDWIEEEELEFSLVEKCYTLRLPRVLAKKLSNLVRPIYLEIMKYLECQRKVSTAAQFLKLSLKCIRWTAYGTVDGARTAEIIINFGKLDMPKQYRLACYYCLEIYAINLWEKLSICQKNYFLNDCPCIRTNIVKCMTYYIRHKIGLQKISNINTLFEASLCDSIKYGNKAAAKFFLEKLPYELKMTKLLYYLKSLASTCFNLKNGERFGFAQGHYSEIAVILIDNASRETLQSLMSGPEGFLVLRILLQWPVQPFFTDVAQYVTVLNHKNCYYATLKSICYKLRSCYMDYDYAILLKEYLKVSPESHNLYDLNPFEILFYLFKAKDTEGVSIILKDSTFETKQKMIFHFNGRELCEYLAVTKRWSLLTFFINKCILYENLGQFQDLFQKVPMCNDINLSIVHRLRYGDRRENYLQLYRFVGNLIHSKGLKRSSEDNIPIAKRTRSLGFTPYKIKIQEEDVEWLK